MLNRDIPANASNIDHDYINELLSKILVDADEETKQLIQIKQEIGNWLIKSYKWSKFGDAVKINDELKLMNNFLSETQNKITQIKEKPLGEFASKLADEVVIDLADASERYNEVSIRLKQNPLSQFAIKYNNPKNNISEKITSLFESIILIFQEEVNSNQLKFQ